jgi:predicted RNA-binding protein associated with RNAse of E/G family
LSVPLVRIHYRRPPDRLEIFEQRLVHDGPDVKVTLAPAVARTSPIRIRERVVLEDRSPVVWFTFPGLWHDVGRFHTADGAFTGLYANVVTPVAIEAPAEGDHRWDTTDLFLDLWVDERGALVLDEDELADAEARGWVDPPTAARARAEVERLRAGAESGVWPRAAVRVWTLERARAALDGGEPGGRGTSPPW